MLPLKKIVFRKKYLIAAHRGASGTETENTLSAFRQAIDDGSDMIELDIQATKDGVIVVHHDFKIEKLDKQISELMFDEIRNLSLNTNKELIPTLEEVLDLIKGKCYVTIEVKSLAINNFYDNANRLLEIVNKFNYLEYTIFASFNYSVLIRLKNLNPNIHTAAIKIPLDKRLPSEIVQSIGCEAYICSIDELSEVINNDIIKNNIVLAIYSVDTLEQIDIMSKFKVKAFGTNYPSKIKELLKS